jgi:pyruvate dehydrogenase E1 component alpha subunit
MQEPLRILEPDGSVTRPELVPTDTALIEHLYKQMRRIRYFDDRAVTLQRQGLLGVYPIYGGQEATQTACALALEPGDWLAPSYRETGAALAFGLPMSQAILCWRYHIQGFQSPDLRLLPFYIPIANQFPHVTGLAMASKLRGESSVALGFMGDGGSSEGDFHVGLNFAGVFNVPAVFVITNNGWAISVPTAKQTAARSIASRGEGYGLPGIQVDGNDVLAVYHVARQAVTRARQGNGPTLIEAITYRIKPHTTSDDPTRYRNETETHTWANERAPLHRMRLFMEHQELWNEQRETAWLEEIETELQQALKLANAAPEPNAWEILEHVYNTPTPTLLEDMRGLGKPGKPLEVNP